MDSSQVAIATITWARSPREEALLQRSLATLAQAGVPVAIADRGTNAGFAAFLKRLAGVTVTVPRRPGLVSQVQASFDVAATFGRAFTLYTEPDKEFFFVHGMSSFLRRVPQAIDVGVAVAARSAESFESFPPMQRYTEGVVNHLCTERMGVAGDYSYGPLLISRALLPHVASLGNSVGWGWRPSTCLAERRAGLPIVHIVDHYPCPPDQQCEDEGERLHRMQQLSQNILGLIYVRRGDAADGPRQR
jgi:hypothetical protein